MFESEYLHRQEIFTSLNVQIARIIFDFVENSWLIQLERLFSQPTRLRNFANLKTTWQLPDDYLKLPDDGQTIN